MERRTFFKAAATTLGVLGLGRILKFEKSFAAGKKAAKGDSVKATDDSLKGLPAATGLTAASFWAEGDNPPNVDHFCNAGAKSAACGPQRKDGQFCGNCSLMLERSSFEGDVVGKCALIQPPKPPKTHVHGHYYCAKYVANATVTYKIK